MLLANNLADVGNVVLRCHEIDQVVDLQHVQTAGNDGFVAALDGYYVVGIVWAAQILQRLVQYLGLVAQLDTQQHQCTVMHIPALAYPRHLQTIDNVDGSKHLRVHQRVNAQRTEQLLVLL